MYRVELYLSLIDHSRFACNSIQTLFSDTLLNISISPPGGVLNFANFTNSTHFEVIDSLKDKLNWMHLACSYLANGTERYLNIGNFLPDSLSEFYSVNSDYPSDTLGYSWNAAVYFIDDVSLTLGIDAGKDTSICGKYGSFIELKASAGWQHYSWSNGAVGRSTNITQPGVYVVTGTIDSLPGFVKTDTVVVSLSPNSMALEQLHLPNDTLICKGQPTQLEAAPTHQNMTYYWSNGESTNPLIVNDSGRFVLLTQLGSCYKYDTIFVSTYPSQQLLDSTVLHLTNLDNIITANPGFTQYHWSTGDTTQSVAISNFKFQILNVEALSGEGCLVKDSVEIFMSELPIIIPNPQTAEEVFRVINLPTGSMVALYNALGESIPINKPPYPISAGIYFYHIVLASGKELKGKIVVI
jgi:hypothetical protein